MDSARGILGVMAQAGLEPSADTYTTLLCGYAQKGDIDSINNTLAECETKEVNLLDKDYLDIIYSLAIHGFKEQIPEILNKVRKAFGYNQDSINIILRLINKGEIDAGLLILKSMPRNTKPDGTQQVTGSFFIKQMVKANYPLEKIIEICDTLEAENMFERALSLATETSLELANETLVYSLLSEMQRKGLKIRQHYFWPLIVLKSNDSTGDGIVDVLIKMKTFDLTPSPETIREYVIPNMKGKSGDIIAKLREANISIGSAACSLVQSLLQKNDIEEAAVIVSRVIAYYYPEYIKRPLTIAFQKTRNLEAYMTILRHIYENLDRKDVVQTEQSSTSDKTEIIGQFILDLTSHPRMFYEEIEKVLKELVNQGLSLSTITAEKIQDKLGEKMTPEISTFLGKLTSGELTPVAIEKKLPSYIPSNLMNIPQLERLIHNLEAKNQDTKGLKRQLLNLYYREKELEKTEKLLKELETQDFVYSTGIYAQLLDIYATHDKLEEAMKYYDKVFEMDPEFMLDETKLIRLVNLLIKNNQFNKAIEILEKTTGEKKIETRSFNYNALCWRMFNSLAEQGKDEELNTLFNCLVKNNFIEVNNVLLGPLVKVHIMKNELDLALQKFEWCCNQFRATPWKNELACKLIQNEDAEKLQKLTDLSTSVHGEINSLYDLVFAFVECGRVRQARKILETPGLQTRPQRINSACQRYQLEGMVQPLEGLKDATKDLNHIDRTDIYYQLLLSYTKQDDPEKALGLWTQMQEEDMAPNDAFLTKLATYLHQKKIEIPFAVPQAEIPSDIFVAENTATQRKDIQQFRQFLKAGDVQKALDVNRNSKEYFSTTDMSLLIEKLVQTENQKEATKITLEQLEKNNPPITRVFRYLLNKLANNGDVKSLEQIGAKMNSDLKKLVSFDNRTCHANLVAGKAEEYLQKLERDIDNAKDEDLAVLGEKFPRGGAVGILDKHPELLEKCK